MMTRKRPFRRYLWRDPDHPEREPLTLWRGEALDRVLGRLNILRAFLDGDKFGVAAYSLRYIMAEWRRDVRLRT